MGEDEIKDRAKRLAKEAITVWSAPSLSGEVLKSYRPQKQQTEKSNYSIESYSHLDNDDILRLFNALQKAVLDLDPCVTQKFLKHYIAYKAENNFLCVKPQSKGLRLSLSLKIHELHDPKEIAKDISNVGRLGTGDVEVHLNTLEELPYIIGLARQALEKQMGSEVEGSL